MFKLISGQKVISDEGFELDIFELLPAKPSSSSGYYSRLGLD